jgi:hypothetical protein
MYVCVCVCGCVILTTAASQGLEPHMDLAYYESPPGIQLLNCMAFPSTVKGGESTFFDTFVLAELLRERDPESFATLLRVPATFQKSHADRCGQRLRNAFSGASFIPKTDHFCQDRLGTDIRKC